MTKYQKSSDAVAALDPMSYEVTQNDATEPPFTGALLDNKEAGLYVDIVSGEPLFLSLHKYESGCGWPSFTQPVSKDFVSEHMDTSHGMTRVEVRSTHGDSHLGHVFPDGPREATGLRYCINSAALRFVPLSDMAEQGYGDLVPLFDGLIEKSQA